LQQHYFLSLFGNLLNLLKAVLNCRDFRIDRLFCLTMQSFVVLLLRADYLLFYAVDFI
jgi:hypothetical protein